MFEQVIHTVLQLKKNLPELQIHKGVRYVFTEYPDCILQFQEPDYFDNYEDVITRLTVFHKDTAIFDCLLTVDTNIEKLCNKIKRKLELL